MGYAWSGHALNGRWSRLLQDFPVMIPRHRYRRRQCRARGCDNFFWSERSPLGMVLTIGRSLELVGTSGFRRYGGMANGVWGEDFL